MIVLRKADWAAWVQTGARVLDVFKAFMNPPSPWHRLNHQLLRDIGKTPAEAELEEYLRGFGSRRPFPVSSREGTV
ncbi:hypothetical protein E0I74_26575 [Rhizobium laguerreae]|uniref:hypothetical protein n=1 Tax=Rhizobium laguerreae TaxID=1076926 RepID=UPI0010388E91|nr:hypothetical protein [Rhizobium laguerreae]TBX74413.1 hypothetical protein E0I74_26575 [Rhizobium laguerreae]TBY13065.1 hypothetical protein E0I94_08070 [Rhizobium laguerreae]